MTVFKLALIIVVQCVITGLACVAIVNIIWGVY